MSDRVVVFVDYQNAYMGAREAFRLHGSSSQGQIDPLRLGELLVARDRPRFNRELAAVRVYRGQPDPERDPRGYSTNDRQCRRWAALPMTKVITRTLRYPRKWPHEREQEKGIDVQLAIDLVVGAVRNEYEVAILMSTDTDLTPALEFVQDLGDARYPRCEVAAWSASLGHSRRLRIPGARIWCHWLDKTDYRTVADPTDYRTAR